MPVSKTPEELAHDLYTLMRHTDADLFQDQMIDLLNEGAKATYRNDDRSLLDYAAMSGLAKVVKALVSKGAKPNIVNDKGFSPLFYAVTRGHVGTIAALIECKADTELRCADGVSVLMAAISNNMDRSFDVLLKNGVNVNSVCYDDERTPLMEACRVRSETMIARLVLADARVDVQDKDGKTAFDYARVAGENVAKALNIAVEQRAHEITLKSAETQEPVKKFPRMKIRMVN